MQRKSTIHQLPPSTSYHHHRSYFARVTWVIKPRPVARHLEQLPRREDAELDGTLARDQRCPATSKPTSTRSEGIPCGLHHVY
eukprot:2507251-Prymnesium_polylepis.1